MSERFTIKPLTGNGAAIVLGDDVGLFTETVIAPACLPAPSFTLQTVANFRAKRTRTIARGNVTAPYTWRVVRIHPTLAASITFERNHIKQICDSCALGEFVLTRRVEGVSMSSTGALQSPRCTQRVGLRTDWEYTWQGTPFE